MARERMVTRTIIESKVTALVCDTESGVCTDKVYTLSAVTEPEVALKQLRKLYNTDSTYIVKVKTVETSEVLYGMSEIDFIKHAKPMQDYFHKPE